MPEKCENCDTVKRHNNKFIHNMNRLKESYDVLKNPTVEGMKAFEEEKSEVKDTGK
ncbi:hypothetical protein Hanom_Chr14g01264431 [Helianthus anomalus]